MTATRAVATTMRGHMQEAQKLLQPVKKDARGCSKELQARSEGVFTATCICTGSVAGGLTTLCMCSETQNARRVHAHMQPRSACMELATATQCQLLQ